MNRHPQQTADEFHQVKVSKGSRGALGATSHRGVFQVGFRSRSKIKFTFPVSFELLSPYSVSRVCAYTPFRIGGKQLKIIPELLS
jgi:hypothetical protein